MDDAPRTDPDFASLSALNNELADLQRELMRRNVELETVRDTLAEQVEERTRALAETIDDLVRAMRAKDAFFARMSHDLRTPLNSVIGFSDVLLQGYAGDLNTEQRTQVTMIHAAGPQLLALVDDILDLSDGETGRVESHAAPLEIRGLLDDVIADALPAAENRGLTLTAEMGRSVRMMTSDAALLRRILLSLLSNAIKYTDEGGVRVRVSVRRGLVEFRVQDTGIGVSEADREIIFQAFTRGSMDDPIKRSGSGLGLAIARQLAEGLGGTLSLERSDATGSTFLLAVPTRTASSVEGS